MFKRIRSLVWQGLSSDKTLVCSGVLFVIFGMLYISWDNELDEVIREHDRTIGMFAWVAGMIFGSCAILSGCTILINMHRESRIKKLNDQLHLLEVSGTAKDVWDFAIKHGVCLTRQGTTIMFEECSASNVANFTASLAHVILTEQKFLTAVWAETESPEDRAQLIGQAVGADLARIRQMSGSDVWPNAFLDALQESRHPSILPAIEKYYHAKNAERSIANQDKTNAQQRAEFRRKLGLSIDA